MKKKSSLILDDDFIQYCKLNNIDDVEKLAADTFKKGFDLLKYGETPVVSFKMEEFMKNPIYTPYIPTPPLPEPPKEEITDRQVESDRVTRHIPSNGLKPMNSELYDE